jgi:hypothetical protein
MITKSKRKSEFSSLLLRKKKIKSPYLILIPCLYILHASEGRIRESKGTVFLKTRGKKYYLNSETFTNIKLRVIKLFH